MTETYRAVAVTSPGKLELVELLVRSPGPGQVRIAVEACGVCHSDAATIEGGFPGLAFPRVPGHEVIGRIEAVGPDVTTWRVGQRVGVGFLGGEDRTCERCRRGDAVNCASPTLTGISSDGGYAEKMIAATHGLAAVPESLDASIAAPLLCAGLTTFNALRNADLRAGDTVAIQGIGGLGHLGVQYARKMGFRTIAIGRGADKASLARALGAHRYIDSAAEDPVEVLRSLGGAHAILATAPSGAAMGSLLPGLAPRGKMLVVAVPQDAIPLSPYELVFGARLVQGSLTGLVIDEEDTLAFSELQDIRPHVETVPLARAAEAYARMMSGAARFRMVLSMGVQ